MLRLPRVFHFGITSKLFIAVLFTNVVTAVAVGFGVRAAFDSGFEQYIREREDQRLSRLADVFANAYRQAGSWDFLRGNDELWIQLNHVVRPPRDGERHPAGAGAARTLQEATPAVDSAFAARPLVPPVGGNPIARAPGPLRPPPSVVLDREGRLVAGDAMAPSELRRRPITVDGQQVGWLAWPVRPTAFDIVDRRFQADQWKASSIVFLLAVLLSAIVAWFLSRGLLAPVKRIAGATRKLADGDYSTRVASASHDELGALVDDFNRLGNALAKNEALRRNFMADVSHELRTPLAILKGELEAIEDGVRPADRGTIASLQAEVARLGKLVEDIHDLSLADVGGLAFHFEDVNLGALVRDAIEGARAGIEARGLAVDLAAAAPELHVRADPARLGQLVFNLLANSLQYTNPGGTLRITLRRHDNRALLLWEDSAPGVPAQALPHIFERLFRVEGSRSRAGGGSGLGLAISRSIVEAHAGTIVARDSDLGGLCIEVQLPLAQASTP